MRERHFSERDQRATTVSADLPWFEIQLVTITTPPSTAPEQPADVSDEPICGELEDEDLCSEHSVRVLGYRQAVSRHDACILYLTENGFGTIDQYLDGFSGFPDQITELVAQDDMDAWVEEDPEEFQELFI